MLINELINKYKKQGHNYKNAQNLAAEEIVLSKIASSPLSEHVTFKGGIVMYNLSKSSRRVTQDLDFDLIRYSIDEDSIRFFVEKLNSISDGVKASIRGDIKKLHQEDYQGIRVNLVLTDIRNVTLKIKLDIGVHTYSAIEQKRILFSFESGDDSIAIIVNPCEQIFAEKLISLARFGPLSTRYKDLYDMYYLLANKLINSNKLRKTLNLFFENSKKKPNNYFELTNTVVETFNNANFAFEASKPANKWLDVEYMDVKESIINFISIL